MSATLMTLIQTTLQQQVLLGGGSEKSAAPASPQRSAGSPTALAVPKCVGQAKEGGGGDGDFATLLQDLLVVAQEISKMDVMLRDAEAHAPGDAEAQKWHVVSLRALGWSRDALAEKQGAILAQLKALATAARAQGGTAPAPTDAAPATKSVFVPAAPSPPPMAEVPPGDCMELAGEDRGLVGSLRADLERLRTYDPERCLLVRRIKRLGLESQRKLQVHFSRFGGVAEVLVAHSFEKPNAKRRHGRVRPAAIAFLVMDTAEATRAILAGGEAHMVEDGSELVEVLAQRFEPQSTAESLGA